MIFLRGAAEPSFTAHCATDDYSLFTVMTSTGTNKQCIFHWMKCLATVHHEYIQQQRTKSNKFNFHAISVFWVPILIYFMTSLKLRKARKPWLSKLMLSLIKTHRWKALFVQVLCINCWCDSLVQLLYKTAWAKHVWVHPGVSNRKDHELNIVGGERISN